MSFSLNLYSTHYDTYLLVVNTNKTNSSDKDIGNITNLSIIWCLIEANEPFIYNKFF